jgi:hypothetical protein
LESVELVTADGRALTCSDRENAELFWAIKGAGHNFGVVTCKLALRMPLNASTDF